MNKNILNFRLHLTTKVFFALIVAAVMFSGCGKLKEEYDKGYEQGKREAEVANANSSEAKTEPTPEPTPVTLSAENLNGNQTVDLNVKAWKYQPGDDSNWANAETDDSGWETINPTFIAGLEPPKSGWQGIGWFRLPVIVDESIVGQPLSFELMQTGASEIYVDGKLVKSFGKVGNTANEEQTYNPNSTPFSVAFAQSGKHMIAIRYSNTEAEKYMLEPSAFQLKISQLNLNNILDETALRNSVKGGIFGISLALGLLHLLLFILYPRQLGNLFFSLFLLSNAASDFIFETFFAHSGAGMVITSMFIGTIAGMVYFVSFTAYLYTVLENRIPRYVKVMLILWLIAVGLIFISYWGIHPIVTGATFVIGVLLFLVLIIWHIVAVSIVIIRAGIRKVDNSWILGIVGLSFVASSVTSIVLLTQVDADSSYMVIGEFVCLSALIIANAVFLARQFARTSTDLERQLVKEVEYEKEKARLTIIESENERRAKELDEARQLQLSMLPKKLPELPNLEIAAYMKPATEVGGDYYDFHIGNDGVLTIAVGDATGHGLKAGTIVTATKSLFNTLAPEPDIAAIFKQSSTALKNMNLRGLYMAMTIVKIKDNRLTVSSAGMPSTLIYRAATGQVEEISIKAMPLGSISNFSYRQQNLNLEKDDCILVMSDGFSEMFNEAGEMLGYDRAQIILRENAHLTAQEILNRFVQSGEKWAGNHPPDDDVTFVVVKMV